MNEVDRVRVEEIEASNASLDWVTDEDRGGIQCITMKTPRVGARMIDDLLRILADEVKGREEAEKLLQEIVERGEAHDADLGPWGECPGIFYEDAEELLEKSNAQG